MKTIYSVLIAALCAAPVSAQPIHGHPQKAAYASPAEYPWLSDQTHLTLSGAPIPLSSPLSTHGVHTEVQCPYMAETAGELLHCKFVIVAFNLAGFAAGIHGELLTNIIYEDSGTAMPAARMFGMPAGLMMWRGTLDIDPKKVVPNFGPMPDHGYWVARIATQTYFGTTVTGAKTESDIWVPFYSVRDVTKPEVLIRSNGKVILEAQSDIRNAAGQADRFGSLVTEILDPIPVAPIDKPWTFRVSFYPYSNAPSLPCGSMEQRLDANFHMGIPGTLIDHEDCFSNTAGFVKEMTLDPTGLTPGPHKMLFAGTWVDPISHEQASVLNVVQFTVAGVVPPLLCTDDQATNKGQPLPCTYPVPDWVTLPGVFQQLGSLFRFCTAPLVCQPFVKP